MVKVLSLFVLLCFSFVCHAQQTVPVQDGIEVGITVSKEVLNRIAIINDRIMTVKGITGQFELDKEPELGQVFLKPVAADSHDLIHLFLITEKGHTYPLSLSLQGGPAQSILLMPIEEETTKGQHSTHYETVLKNLAQAIVNNTSLTGLVKEEKPVLKIIPKIKNLKIMLLQSYSGYNFKVQVLRVTNTGKEDVVLQEQDFYQPGIRAITILNPDLAPKTKTLVTVVK